MKILSFKPAVNTLIRGRNGVTHDRTQTFHEDRARDFQKFKNDFPIVQREKNGILRALASHIMQQK